MNDSFEFSRLGDFRSNKLPIHSDTLAKALGVDSQESQEVRKIIGFLMAKGLFNKI